MQAKLAASEEKYRDLYEFAPIGYFTLEPSGEILEANLTAASLLGTERASLSEQPVPGLSRPGTASRSSMTSAAV